MGNYSPSVLAKARAALARLMANPELVITISLMVVMVVSGVANSVLFKLTMISFQNYPFWLLTIYNLLGIPPTFIGYWMKLRAGKITKENLAFPHKRFVVMGLLDAISNTILLFAGNQVNGPLMTVIGQAVIPITMVFSKFFLGVRYRWSHSVGSLIILSGVGLSLVPEFRSGAISGSAFWLAFLFSANFFLAASSVYKEHAFKTASAEIWQLQLWDNVWTFIFSLPTVPLNLVLPPKMTWADIADNCKGGALCMVGKNSTVGDNCTYSTLILLVFLTINILANIVILAVVQRTSASVSNLLAAAILPLSNIAFAMPFIMGKYATPLSVWNALALVAILSGLFLYKLHKEQMPSTAQTVEGGDAHAEAGGEYYIDEEDEDLVESEALMAPGAVRKVKRRPLFLGSTLGAAMVSNAVMQPNVTTVLRRRDFQRIRTDYFSRLGLAVN